MEHGRTSHTKSEENNTNPSTIRLESTLLKSSNNYTYSARIKITAVNPSRIVSSAGVAGEIESNKPVK
jgi:hypothetical protein